MYNQKIEYNMRPYVKADLESIYQLVKDTIEACYPSFYTVEAVDFFVKHHAIENIESDCVKGFCVVVEENEKIIGTGTLIGACIQRVFVHTSFQGKGIGKKIMDALEKRALDLGQKYIYLHSSLYAKKFYDRLGLLKLRHDCIKVKNDKLLEYYWMAKSLLKNREREYNLDGKSFNVIMNNGPDAEVDNNTIFEFRQFQSIVFAIYQGGMIKSGTLVGVIYDDFLEFSYEQENISGIENKGHSIDKITIGDNGKIQLIDEWQWETKEGSGKCIMEEM